ncbi:MAG: Flp pilus assembly complex ATPase component TadA [Erysipelotrichaceae bacterium]|nr:Flp pilus assembly complex ATPase component TadA [Erysipelotrichaceae bacterium]
MDDLFESLIDYAINHDATDIHMTLKQQLIINMRIFGQVKHYLDFDYTTGSRLLNYLKFKSAININYKLMPQTGAFHFQHNEHTYFLRLSFLPGQDFESIVIRILNNHQSLSIDDLSPIKTFTRFIRQIASLSSGLFLVSGATGSGKSTTLYAMIDYIIAQGGRHIVTLEDPIEMVKDGCLQIEMNDAMGISYETTLRQILRHDPDVIMIGEIRDERTAALAITCALTGHLVLSTIHASNTHLVIKRLLNLGVKSTDLQDVLVGIASQKIIYDHKQHKIIILPEMMIKETINAILCEEKPKVVNTFSINARYLVAKGYISQALVKGLL